MEIWVDADACPGVIREILFRAATRTGVRVTLVANHPIGVPKSPSIRMIQVVAGFDGADAEIVRRCQPNDLVITADIPLAAEVLAKGAIALSPRGELYTSNDIKAKLTMRDFMDTMRASGMVTGGPPVLNQSDRKLFAGHLDSILARER
jgi:uncharacterized protein YaiI (UPF0178 family)